MSSKGTRYLFDIHRGSFVYFAVFRQGQAPKSLFSLTSNFISFHSNFISFHSKFHFKLYHLSSIIIFTIINNHFHLVLITILTQYQHSFSTYIACPTKYPISISQNNELHYEITRVKSPFIHRFTLKASPL